MSRTVAKNRSNPEPPTRSLDVRTFNAERLDPKWLQEDSRREALIRACEASQYYTVVLGRLVKQASGIDQLSLTQARGFIREVMPITSSLVYGLIVLAYETEGLRDEAEVLRSNAAKGGAAKFAKSPMQEAKDEANELWSLASKKGWTAERLWTELTGRGHPVKFDTVRKWMTNLRKTGVC